MAWLNYHHLLYFWTVAREGTIAGACRQLHLTEPTISGQLRRFQKRIGTKLFERAGRRLVLTNTGSLVYQYATDIFSLGRELQDTLKGDSPGRPQVLTVGVADTVDKLMAYRIIEPALHLEHPIQLCSDQGKPEHLLAQLAAHALDVVIADAPASPSLRIRAFNHLLGECGVSLFATADLVARYRRRFPKSLDGAPFLLPAENTVLRRSLEQWFQQEQVRPSIRGEFADSALLKVFGHHGAGIFAVRSAVEWEMRRYYGLHLVGRVPSIRERFYAISLDRKLKHPAILAVTSVARQVLFA